jgi:hypothetical protein
MKIDPDSYVYQWRITKYDPAKRNEQGHYTGDDWVMVQQIGSVVNGKTFTKEEYLEVEDRYVAAAEEFFRESGLETLLVSDLRQSGEIASHITEHGLDDIKDVGLSEGQPVTAKELDPIMRLLLREVLWCKLENPGKFFIHIGWDYYMYIGCSENLTGAVAKTNKDGLYVESFVSPYLEA